MSTRARALAFLLLLPWGFASLSGVPVEPDARKIDPVLIASDSPAVLAVQRKLAGSPMRAGAPVPLFFRLEREDPSFPDTVRQLGGAARKVAPRIYTGQIPRDAARYLSNRPEVSYLEAARRARPMLDVSAPAVFADDVHAGSVGWPFPFSTGILGGTAYVAVVDTGLDNAHLDFHTGGSGSPLRVVHTYSSPDLLPVESNPLTDQDGHGTHVAGIAAGNGFSSGGTYTGMAPLSPILVGKTSFFTSDIVNAVSDLVSFAGTTPVSVNLSLGLPTGPHDGTSAFESSINFLATGTTPGTKRLIAVAAGNERGGREHFRESMPPFGVVTEFLALEDTVAANAQIWADGEDWYRVTATMGSEAVTLDSNFASALINSPSGRISISAIKHSPLNGDTFLSVFFSPQTAGQTGSIQLTRTRNGGDGILDGYIDRRDGTFDTPAESGTIIEPANGDNVIAVGSYNTKSNGGAGPIGDISSFSSLGPTRDGRSKPDLAAPGSLIYSARSRDASFLPIQIAPNDNYVILQGTSMATPHVAGIAALVWESNPSLTGAQMRARLKHTADPPPGAPDNTWGHGKVNALRAVSESVASITAPAAALPGTVVTATSENSSGAFGNPLTGYTWTLTPLPTGPPAILSTSNAATFTAPATPGNYRIDLTVSQSAPIGTPAGIATTILHVNHPPDNVLVSGPSSSDNTAPALFQGSSADSDPGQSATFRWVLVSRPSGSLATVSPITGSSGTTLSPDKAGTYEIGLRVDDTLDNSALALKTYTVTQALTGSGGGGGGGCSLPPGGSANRSASPSGPVLLLLPLAVLGVLGFAGKRIRRRNR